jgi:hypothetical protein
MILSNFHLFIYLFHSGEFKIKFPILTKQNKDLDHHLIQITILSF